MHWGYKVSCPEVQFVQGHSNYCRYKSQCYNLSVGGGGGGGGGDQWWWWC